MGRGAWWLVHTLAALWDGAGVSASARRGYGPDSFSFEVLDELPPTEEPREDPKEELRVLESLWLERLRPYGTAGYNTPP